MPYVFTKAQRDEASCVFKQQIYFYREWTVGLKRPMQFSLTLVIYLKSASKEKKKVMVMDGVAPPRYKVVRHHVLPNNASF
jgi:hypothetical protein